MTDEDNGDTTASTTNETRELTVSRVVGAPPERVHEAFVDPDELARWMHPPGATCEVHHFEPEEGGTYRITMSGETPDGGEYSHTYGGTFRELVPGERIVQTEAPEADDTGMAGEMTVTITFDDVPDGTEVTVLLEIPAAWPDEAIGGWEAALGNLAGLLESTTDDTHVQTTDTSLTIRRTFDASRERVWRAFTDPEDLAEWYAPGDMTPEIHAWEATPDGELDISMVDDEGSHDAEGAFTEVIENEKLVHTWRWTHDDDSPETVMTVEFADVEGGTEVVLTHERLPNAESVEEHIQGWTGVLANLAALLRERE